MHLQIRCALEGQRPADKPAQGNALGTQEKYNPAR